MSTNYSIVIETLKTMYKEKKLDDDKLKTMLAKKAITSDEYDYISVKDGG